MVIRDAVPEDWPAIWRILHEIIVAGETLTADPDRTSERSRAGWMEKRNGRVFVAVDAAGEVVGSANLYPNHQGPGSHVACAGFIVAAAHRGKGIGRALGEHILEQARLGGYSAMQFNAVVETNAASVGLWRALGFKILATVPEAFRHPREGLVGLHIMYRRL